MAITYFFEDGPFSYVSPTRSATGLPVVTEISANDYLAYARDDLKRGDQHGLINALGNAKKCQHLLIDSLLQNFGLLALNLSATFPKKLRLLDEVGLISLNIFRKLNIERNLVEHEYRKPTRETIEDAIDVCHLLTLATAALSEEVCYEAFVGWRASGKQAMMSLEPTKGTLSIREVLDAETNCTKAGVEYISGAILTSDRATTVRIAGTDLELLRLTYSEIERWSRAISNLVEIQGYSIEDRGPDALRMVRM